LASINNPIEKALTIALGLFLLLVLYRGGNVSVAIALGAGIAVALFLLAIVASLRGAAYAVFTIPWGLLVTALTLIVIGGGIGLIPIDATTFHELAGRDYYDPVLSAIESSVGTSVRWHVSLDTQLTRTSLLVALGALAIALAVPHLSRPYLMAILGIYVMLALIQALIGLMQLGLGSPSFLAFGSAIGGRRAAGTFVNKNHYATFLAMALPLLLMRSVGRFSFFTKREKDTRLRRSWWGFATAFTAAALVSSVSRAGTAAGFFVAVITVIVCATSSRDRTQRIAFVLIGAAALGIAALSGIQLMLTSLEGTGFEQGVESRHLLNRMTFAGVTTFFPIGAGLGSFAVAFPRFQSEKFVGFVEHAHNDYLQLLFELGLIGVFVLVALAAAWLLQARKLVLGRKVLSMANPATACLLGVLAFAIHAWFDFPAHIPSIAWTATLLFAISFHPALTTSNMSTRIARG
jgi:O-Antigen ligase